MTKTIKFTMRHILTLMFALVCCLQISAADDFDLYETHTQRLTPQP